MRLEHVGGAVASSLASALGGTTADLTILCNALTNWPTGVVGPFYVTMGRGTATEEKVLCSSRSGNTLTVWSSGMSTGRGADGTSISSHDTTETIEHTFTGTEADAANAHIEATGNVHGVTGDLAAADDLLALDADLTAAIADIATKVAKSTFTTKGDVLAATASSTPARVAVGTDGQVLTADAASTPGVKWASPVLPGMKWVAGAACSADTSKNIDFAFAAGKKYKVVWSMEGVASVAGLLMRTRSGGTTDSGSNYGWGGAWSTSISLGGFSTDGGEGEVLLSYLGDAKKALAIGHYMVGAADGSTGGFVGGLHNSAAAQSGLNFTCSAYTMTGRIDIYELEQTA